MRYVLASQSPRRRELLDMLLTDYEVIVSDEEENTSFYEPDRVVCELSLMKAVSVQKKLKEIGNIVIIGADTVVSCDDRILGKPKNDEDAKNTLRLLSGRDHYVYTGVTVLAVINNKTSINTFYEKTRVTMYEISDEEIDEYVCTGEPADKAGSYAIQGLGTKYIKCIDGDYNNVVGLPVSRLYQEMKTAGLL